MLSHRIDRDADEPQTETRGPVMGASASSNCTAAFDESSGILGFVSRRFRRSNRKKKKIDEVVDNPTGNEIGIFISDQEGGGDGNGHGSVVYERKKDQSDTTSSSTRSSNRSSGTGMQHGDRRDVSVQSSVRAAVDVVKAAEGGHGKAVQVYASPTVKTEQHREAATLPSSSRSAKEERGPVGSGHVRVSSPPHDSITTSSDTEYAPPSNSSSSSSSVSSSGDTNNDDDDPRKCRDGAHPKKRHVLPPVSHPPPHAFTAGAHQTRPVSKARGDAGGVAAGGQHHNINTNAAGEGSRHDAAQRGEAVDAAVARDSKAAARSSASSLSTHSSQSATTSSTTTTDSDSDEDDDDDDEDEDEADSGERVYSKMTNQSEAASSRLPYSDSGVRRHTMASPTSANYYAPTRDVRSSLVSTIDVDVAVARERRKQRQHQLYLQAALRQGASATSPSTSTTSATATPVAQPSPLTPAQSSFLQQRADAVYRRHMDALVEQYLSAPRYRTALAQFRKHLSVPEQEMRTSDARSQYLRATEIVVARGQDGVRGTADGTGRGSSADALYNGAGAAGRESDWWRVGSGGTDDAAAASAAGRGGGAADAFIVKSGSDRYRLEKTDLELFAGDSARRARLLDDTLPWRPIDFDATGIRLEALEHLQADLGGTDTVTGGSAAAPAVGGSVNLLIEVLILTEMDIPFTSTIPMVNYTNVFLLLASLFVQSEVLLTKLIRFYRSVRAWEAEVEDTSRAVYLERRVLQCILVYCRVHEADLTLSCLQRLAVFVASEGFLGPVNALDDAVGKAQWPCQEGVYCAARRRAAAYAHATGSATAASPGASPTTVTTPGAGGFGSVRHYKRYGFVEPRRAADVGVAGLFPQRNATFDPAALLNPATRAPLQNEVAQTLLEFIVYLQRTIVVYYRPIEITPSCRQSLPFAPEGPLRMFVDTAVLRPSLGCTSSSLRTAMTADPRLSPEAFSSFGARFSERVSGLTVPRGSSSSPPRDHRFGGAGAAAPHSYDGAAGGGNHRTASQGSSEAQQSVGLEGGGMGGWAAAAGPNTAATTNAPQASTLETTVMQRPLSVVEIDSEHLSRQICLLSFSLFTAVHIRELLNNAWTDTSMKASVSTKLAELMEFSAHLQRWTAAVIVTPASWAECQRGLRYFLEVCRMLYEQQNYEMAAAILEGLRHPSVEYLERAFAEARGQGLLTSAERREMETLQELMDPFASYSPSSLYSVTARTVGDMETPMIPLLSPVLGVIFRSEDIKGATVSIRVSDGQAVVNWSKVIGLGKMVVLWMRCQYTPFAFPIDPEAQEFLWSTMNHQWTDALLMRAARRVKQ